MFKISPIQTAMEQTRVALACETVYRNDYLAFAMTDDGTGEIMGFSQFDIRGEVGYLSDLMEAEGHDDYEAMFILGKATLSFLDQCGIKTVIAPIDAGKEQLLVALGFTVCDTGEYTLDISNMFGGHCSGH